MTSKSLLSLLACCVVLGSGHARAQGKEVDRGPFGFIRLMHAVSMGTGKLDVLIDGEPVRPEGYQLGDMTGGIPLRPKTYNVEIRREGVKKGETTVTVVNDHTTTLVAFAELVPAIDNRPAYWQIRILRLKQFDEKSKRTATFISVSREPDLKVEINQAADDWEPVFVKRLVVARTNIKQASGYLTLRCKGTSLEPHSIFPSGNFVSVFYDDEKGVVRSTNFIDYKYLSDD